MCGIVLIMPKRGKLIGREGMTGLPIVVGDHLSPQSIQAVVGQRIDAIVLRKAINSSPSLPLGFIEICAGLHDSD